MPGLPVPLQYGAPPVKWHTPQVDGTTLTISYRLRHGVTLDRAEIYFDGAWRPLEVVDGTTMRYRFSVGYQGSVDLKAYFDGREHTQSLTIPDILIVPTSRLTALVEPVSFRFPAELELRRYVPPPPEPPKLTRHAFAYGAQMELKRSVAFNFGSERLPATRIIQMRRDDEDLLALM